MILSPIAETELILNADGSVYHLRLKPEHIADDVIVVGDPGRVEAISKHFSKVEHRIQNREFITHTGIFNGKRITVIATGIGTDNIDIVLNELDAAVNIDLDKRELKTERRSLNIIRLGTSGALQADIPVDSFVVSEYGLGFDGLLNYYAEIADINDNSVSEAFIRHTNWNWRLPFPYAVKGSDSLRSAIAHDWIKGITATAPGFYAPQGRKLRLDPAMANLNELLTSFDHNGSRITNFEMETSALYGLSTLLGHRACTICVIIANRVIRQYSKDYKLAVERLITAVLERLTA
jgi:uridine phosphorylase